MHRGSPSQPAVQADPLVGGSARTRWNCCVGRTMFALQLPAACLQLRTHFGDNLLGRNAQTGLLKPRKRPAKSGRAAQGLMMAAVLGP